jgi:hypothetical protein
MANEVIPEKYWSMCSAELAEEGWCCDFVRIDTETITVFALEAHRHGIHHIVISDELLPAVLEFYLQTKDSVLAF